MRKGTQDETGAQERDRRLFKRGRDTQQKAIHSREEKKKKEKKRIPIKNQQVYVTKKITQEIR